MNCQYCQKRKAHSTHYDEGLKANVQLCRKCARTFYPTPEQQKEGAEQDMHRAERQAEMGAESTFQYH